MKEIKKLRRLLSVREDRTELIYICIEVPYIETDPAASAAADEMMNKYVGNKAKPAEDGSDGTQQKPKDHRRKGRDVSGDKKGRGTYGGGEIIKTAKKNKALLFNMYYYAAACYSLEWAKEFAQKSIKTEYESLGVRERKFCFKRYIYYIKSEVKELDGGILSITCTYTLMRSGQIVFQKSSSELWDGECNLIISKNQYKTLEKRIAGGDK